LAFKKLWKGERPGNIKNLIKHTIENGKDDKSAMGVMADMIEAATIVYEDIQESIYQRSENDREERNEAMRPMRNWLESQLPMLLSQWFAPTADGDAEGRDTETTRFLKGNGKETKLVQCWKRNSPFLLADIEQQWAELFFSKVGFVPFGPFENLLRDWSRSDSNGG
jgi:hypothetical protein